MKQDFRACTVAYNGKSNVLRSQVRISTAFDPNKNTPPPKSEFVAIWDTGASASVISKNVAEKCGLRQTGVAPVHTVGGRQTSPTYLVCIDLPNRVGFPSVRVTEGELSGGDVLIGMDIIGMGDFSVTNHKGKTVFSFRVPSVSKIDFVAEAKAQQSGGVKIGRNDPCSCGSGKKYKRCCGK